MSQNQRKKVWAQPQSRSCFCSIRRGAGLLKDLITHQAPADVFKFFYLLVSLRHTWNFFVHDVS